MIDFVVDQLDFSCVLLNLLRTAFSQVGATSVIARMLKGAELPMHVQREPVYEYACHEGNYALPGILAGAREEERAKAAGGK